MCEKEETQCLLYLIQIFAPYFTGGYGVKNNKNSRKFLKAWADLEFDQPKGFSSADNGAIHVALMKWFKGINDTKSNECIADYKSLEADVLNLNPYYNFLNCTRGALGIGSWKDPYNDNNDVMLKEFRSKGLYIVRRDPFNNYVDKMRGEGVKKCLFLSTPAQWRGEGSKDGKILST